MPRSANGSGAGDRDAATGGIWEPPHRRGAEAEPPDWSAAVRRLRRVDPVLRAVIARAGPCTLRPRGDQFETLVGAILSQQISNRAAATIHRRLLDRAGGRAPTAEWIRRRRDSTLQKCGISRQKIRSLRELSARVGDGRLDLGALRSAPDERVRETLTEIPGIGAWTAEMHLIFTLNRPDVFPFGDGAVRAAVRALYGLDERAREPAYQEIAGRWKPYRSVATWYLYEHLHMERAAAAAARAGGG